MLRYISSVMPKNCPALLIGPFAQEMTKPSLPTASLQRRVASSSIGSRPSFSGSGTRTAERSVSSVRIEERICIGAFSGCSTGQPSASASMATSVPSITESKPKVRVTFSEHSASVCASVAYSRTVLPSSFAPP